MSIARSLALLLLVGLLLAASPAAAQSASLQILAQDRIVQGHLSQDGRHVGIRAADTLNRSWVVEIATGERRAEIENNEGLSAPHPSADGSVIRGTNGQENVNYRFENGAFTFESTPARYFTRGVSSDGETVFDSRAVISGGLDGPIETIGSPGVSTRLPFALDISGGGDRVVGYTRSGGSFLAFQWEDGVTESLDAFDLGLNESLAHGISQDGTTVVGFGRAPAQLEEALAWRNGEVQALGFLPDTERSSARAASGDGSIVVGSAQARIGAEIPFLWDAENGMRDLRTLLTAAGIDVAAFEAPTLPGGLFGKQLRRAIDISADGRTILGEGRDWDTDEPFLWVATIPEPSTGLLVGLGLAGLAARRPGRAEARGAKR